MTAAQAMLDIAVGILRDERGNLLLAQRRPGTLGAGQWEFPGGKHEPGETLQATLARELDEELGITPRTRQPLIRMHNGRAALRVRLHVWLITDWQGMPYGREGQRLVWCPQDELPRYDLLPGNQALLNALRLPGRYAITPSMADSGRRAWLQSLQATLQRGIRLLRLRLPALDDAAYAELAAAVIERAHAVGAQVLLDRSPAMVHQLGADGLHWSAARATEAENRPLTHDYWFAVSVHDPTELQTAARLDADFATLSPLHATASHPKRQALGWAGWQALRADVSMPVYALGGLSAQELKTARAYNAQGVAAIRAFWGG